MRLPAVSIRAAPRGGAVRPASMASVRSHGASEPASPRRARGRRGDGGARPVGAARCRADRRDGHVRAEMLAQSAWAGPSSRTGPPGGGRQHWVRALPVPTEVSTTSPEATHRLRQRRVTAPPPATIRAPSCRAVRQVATSRLASAAPICPASRTTTTRRPPGTRRRAGVDHHATSNWSTPGPRTPPPSSTGHPVTGLTSACAPGTRKSDPLTSRRSCPWW